MRSRIFGTFVVKFLACLASPRIFEHLRNGKIAHFQRIFTLRDWSKSIEGGWAGAFGNVVDKKHMTHPPPFGTKMTDPPLKQGWKLHDPPPS